MSLPHTLLGFLNLGPMSGYDLKKTLDVSTQAFWHARLSQIYPTLKRLEGAGQVESEVKPQKGKPDRRVYRITAEGRAELLKWLAEPVTELERVKDAALLKLFFSGFLDREGIVAHLRAQLSAHRAEWVRLREEVRPVVASVVATRGLAREGRMWELVRELGERLEATHVEWLEWAIGEVEARG